MKRCSRVPAVFLSVFFIGAAVATWAAVAPWPMFRHDASRSGASDLPGPSDPGLLWSFNPPTSGGIPISGIYSAAAVSGDGAIYIGAMDNNFYALTSRGAVNWSYATEYFIVNSAAIGDEGRVHFGSILNMYSLTSAGSLVWSYTGTAGGSRFSSPAVGTDGSLYVGSGDNILSAFTRAGSMIWSYRTADYLYASASLGTDGMVYVGSDDNNFYAFLSTGSLLWSYTTGNQVSHTACAAPDGKAFVPSEDNTLYAFSPGGSLSWSYDMPISSFYGPAGSLAPALTGSGKLYISSGEDHLYCLTSTGQLLWSYGASMEPSSSPVLGADDVAYITGFDGILRAVESEGTLLWTYTSGSILSANNIALANNRRILLSTLCYFYGGGLQCIGQRPPSLDIIPSNNSPSAGDPFTVEVTVKPVGGAFDAWLIIFAPGGKKFSFNIKKPSSLRPGVHPLALNVPGLKKPYHRILLSISRIPNGAVGTYQIYGGLVPEGRAAKISNAIPDYFDHETVVIH